MNSSTIKVRWRKQEIIFFTAVFALLTGRYIWEAFTISTEQIYERHKQAWDIQRDVFKHPGFEFNYNMNVLLPQLMVALTVYLAYCLLNRIKIISLLSPLWFFLINAGLAFCVAFATDFARPYLGSY